MHRCLWNQADVTPFPLQWVPGPHLVRLPPSSRTGPLCVCRAGRGCPWNLMGFCPTLKVLVWELRCQSPGCPGFQREARATSVWMWCGQLEGLSGGTGGLRPGSMGAWVPSRSGLELVPGVGWRPGTRCCSLAKPLRAEIVSLPLPWGLLKSHWPLPVGP